MAIYHEDIVDIDLNSGSIHRSFLMHSIGEADKNANRFGIRTFRDGEPETLGTAVCTGYFIRADGGTVLLDTGVVDENVAYVTLPQSCYAVEGNFCLVIKMAGVDASGTNVTGTMRIIDGVVTNTTTDTVIDPGGVIPDINDLLELIEEAEAAIAGSVRYDVTQELTEAQRNTARNNIGMISVSFDQISGDDYMMTVSTNSEFVQISGDDYMLVTMAD